MTARLDWKDVRGLIEKQTGPVLAAEPVTAGLNSEIAVVVYTSLGATFVKGLRCSHRRIWTQQREAEINPYVLRVSPRLRWHVKTDGWNLLGFEHVAGRHVDYSPGSPDLPKVVQAMRLRGQIPCPDLPLGVAQRRWLSYTDAPELFAGDHLLHTEWNPGNVLVNDAAHLVDWAWATRGAGWIDPACWVVWLVASGHSPQAAEDWATQIPAWHAAPRNSLDEFARAQASMWGGIALDSPEQWTQRVAGAAQQWVEHRNAHATRNRKDPCS
ncbi:MAG: aminoglycoside phosphotransferase [Actinomycetota bacterium]|nr:aminoglycoside phosphotransferase [Actinomycetota bacterium]